jgi:hypothetical protein
MKILIMLFLVSQAGFADNLEKIKDTSETSKVDILLTVNAPVAERPHISLLEGTYFSRGSHDWIYIGKTGNYGLYQTFAFDSNTVCSFIYGGQIDKVSLITANDTRYSTPRPQYELSTREHQVLEDGSNQNQGPACKKLEANLNSQDQKNLFFGLSKTYSLSLIGDDKIELNGQVYEFKKGYAGSDCEMTYKNGKEVPLCSL